MKKRNLFSLIAVGILSGALLANAPWVLFLSAVTIFFIFIVRKVFSEEEAGFLIKLFLISLFMRVVAVLILRPFILLYGNGLDVGDGMVFIINGATIAETIKGGLNNAHLQDAFNSILIKAVPAAHLSAWKMNWILPDWAGVLPVFNLYQVGGYVYFLSALYYLFGFSPLTGIFFNCILGAALCLFVYYIAKRISGNMIISRLSAILTAFFPSLFLWSITSQKDIAVIFSNLMVIVCLIKVLKERKYLFLFPAALVSLALYFLRPNFISVLFLWYAFISLLPLFLWARRRKTAFILPIILFTLVFILSQTLGTLEKAFSKTADKAHSALVAPLIVHKNIVCQGGNYYKILDEQYYSAQKDESMFYGMPFGNVLKAYFLGLIHFIFEPLPAGIHNFSTLIAYPQAILVYFLLLFFIPGVIIALKCDFRLFLVLFSYLSIFSFPVAFGEGNVGGLLRHRDIVTPIFIIFSSIGFSILLRNGKYNA